MTAVSLLRRTYHVGALLLDCACQQLSLTDAGCPDRRCLVPGSTENVERVNCCDQGGQLTVNVVRAFPSRDFPTADLGSPSNCDAPWTVITYNIEIVRCHPVGDVERAPSCSDLDDVALTTWMDMEAVRQGVACCLRDTDLVSQQIGYGYRWNLGDHTTFGPEGGCVGSDLVINVGVPTCWDC